MCSVCICSHWMNLSVRNIDILMIRPAIKIPTTQTKNCIYILEQNFQSSGWNPINQPVDKWAWPDTWRLRLYLVMNVSPHPSQMKYRPICCTAGDLLIFYGQLNLILHLYVLCLTVCFVCSTSCNKIHFLATG